MKKLYKIIYVLVIMILMSSCGLGLYTNKTMRTGTFMPNHVRLDMSMDDFEFLGEMEVSVKYSSYLGFFSVYDEINGQEVARRNRNTVTLVGMKNIHLTPKIKEALFQAHVKIPDADFLIPVYEVTERQKMFLGNKVKTTVKVKAYRIKDN